MRKMPRWCTLNTRGKTPCRCVSLLYTKMCTAWFNINAEVVELVDTRHLKCREHYARAGSNPALGTVKEILLQKLNSCFQAVDVFDSEGDVLYVLIQIRRILELDSDDPHNGKYTTLRFYADWVAHTKKTRMCDKMNPTLSRIDEKAFEQMKAHPRIFAEKMDEVLGDFLIAKSLYVELHWFLGDHSVSKGSLSDITNWFTFLKTLHDLLRVTPLEFAFTSPRIPQCIREVEFINPSQPLLQLQITYLERPEISVRHQVVGRSFTDLQKILC